MPSINDKKIYVRSLNVNKINVIVNKIYVNNTTQFLQKFDFTGNGKYSGDYYYNEYDNTESYDSTDYVGDVIYNKYFDIENDSDVFVQTAIDLDGILDTNGIYIIDVKFDDKGTTYTFPSDMDEYDINYYLWQNGRITKTILLTDIGIMAQKNDDGIHVNVFDIVKNNTLSGAKVYLMSINNQILEEKTTDNKGIVDFENYKKSFYILVENDLFCC